MENIKITLEKLGTIILPSVILRKLPKISRKLPKISRKYEFKRL